MFTVKHTTRSYSESLYSCTDVRFEPSSTAPGQVSEPTSETVWLYGGDVGNTPLTGGVVYVMNDHGATVAKYDLEAALRGPDKLEGLSGTR